MGNYPEAYEPVSPEYLTKTAETRKTLSQNELEGENRLPRVVLSPLGMCVTAVTDVSHAYCNRFCPDEALVPVPNLSCFTQPPKRYLGVFLNNKPIFRVEPLKL